MKGTKTGRRLRTGIYRQSDRWLFVPMVEMLDARDLFDQARKNGRPASINRVSSGRKQIDYWLKLYSEVPWFRGWLIEGKEPPSEVHVPTKGEVNRMLAACAYSRHMLAIGLRRTDYTKYLAKRAGGFPAAQISEWMEWLYGGKEPASCVVVSELAVLTRDELARDGICRAARLPIATFTRWKAAEMERRALSDMISRRRVGGGAPVASGDYEALFGVGLEGRLSGVANAGQRAFLAASAARSKHAMLRFAACATETSAVQRARRRLARLSPATLSKEAASPLRELRQRAEALGLKDDLDRYIYEFVDRISAPPSLRPEKGKWKQRGAVRHGLFVAVLWLWRFRKHAQMVWNRHQIGQIEASTPCFRLWFLDWTLPLAHRGSNGAYRRAVGLAPQGRTPYRIAPPKREAAATAAKGEGVGTAAATIAIETGRRRPVGRPADERIAQRNRDMRLAWDSKGDDGRWRYESFGDLGRAFGVSRVLARKVIKAGRCKRRT